MFRGIQQSIERSLTRVVPEIWGRHENGAHTEFWRDLSWMVGDDHADRICRGLDVYARLFKISKGNARARPPGRS